jgi:hypothetical protein
MRKLIAALVIALPAITTTGGASAGEKCSLQKVASVPMTITAGGTVTVPITIAGDTLTFALSINDGFSAISSDYAEKKGFHLTSNLPNLLHFNFLDGTATAPEVMFGDLSLQSVQFLRGDVTRNGISGISGTIGWNLLGNYDVELDFKNNRLNLFSQDHCPGNVVYWASSYSNIPFAMDAAGNLVYELKLDGKPASAGFDTVRGYGHMASGTAKELFGVATLDGLTKTGNLLYGSEETYKYPFQSLEFGAFTFKQPEIYIYQGPVLCRPSHMMRCYGAPEITVGADQLRKLHLFYALKEGKLYVTTADAHL